MRNRKHTLNLSIKAIAIALILTLTACGNSAESAVNKNYKTESNVGNEETLTSQLTDETPETGGNKETSSEQEIATNQETSDNGNDIDVSISGMAQPDYSTISIPEYSGKPYAVINNNEPYFTESDLSTVSYEYYSELDSLGRCGVTYACIGTDIMPTEERGAIGQVKPTGWHTVKYDNVDGKYLYNRCHLIGYQLTGENANTQNLITGTRSMNVDGMLPFENMAADYIKETGNHVMYRVTPIFKGNNLLADGVLMEAKSVEDDGEGILFNVFVYNVQDGITINYTTGDSRLKETPTTTDTLTTTEQPTTTQIKTTTEQETTTHAVEKNVIIANKNSKAYHRSTCSRLPLEKNRVYFDSAVEAEAEGYNNPCAYCNP